MVVYFSLNVLFARQLADHCLREFVHARRKIRRKEVALAEGHQRAKVESPTPQGLSPDSPVSASGRIDEGAVQSDHSHELLPVSPMLPSWNSDLPLHPASVPSAPN